MCQTEVEQIALNIDDYIRYTLQVRLVDYFSNFYKQLTLHRSGNFLRNGDCPPVWCHGSGQKFKCSLFRSIILQVCRQVSPPTTYYYHFSVQFLFSISDSQIRINHSQISLNSPHHHDCLKCLNRTLRATTSTLQALTGQQQSQSLTPSTRITASAKLVPRCIV